MSKIAIRAENISKQYRLGEIGTGTISHDLNRWWHKVRGKEDPFLKIGESNDRSRKGATDYVWSLKDINFEINQGDAVGIIGRNGAGKSTLLKLLSKVTKPTTGQFKVNGRIASLLEVGTGFHPEMTGRENIYLNGAILGMRRSEITRKFDEIVDFAGIERYIDTPVKRYSSGMYVRLAFAVAAHLESEILIVDEVLAVGDAEFQKKCLGKMGDVSKGEGRTVLFVSHNLPSIFNLCTQSILLTNGQIEEFGDTQDVAKKYIELGRNRVVNYGYRNENNDIEFDYGIYFFQFLTYNSNPYNDFKTSDKLELKCGVYCNRFNPSVIISISLFNIENVKIFTIYRKISDLFNTKFASKNIEFIIKITPNLLPSSSYYFQIDTHIPGQKVYHYVNEVCNFRILDDSGLYEIYPSSNNGVILPQINIEILN
jgi:lipopolysaccharide transport system ATP-binding protein